MSKDVGHESSQSQASGIRTKKVPQLKALAQIRFVSIGVFEKLLAEIIGKLPLVGEQNLLEPKNVLEAGIVDLSGCINRRTLLKVTLRTILKSASMGLLAGRLAAAEIQGTPLSELPQDTATGALVHHITGGAEAKTFQPMNVNFGLFRPVEGLKGGRRGRTDRYKAYTDRAKAAWTEWLQGQG